MGMKWVLMKVMVSQFAFVMPAASQTAGSCCGCHRGSPRDQQMRSSTPEVCSAQRHPPVLDIAVNRRVVTNLKVRTGANPIEYNEH